MCVNVDVINPTSDFLPLFVRVFVCGAKIGSDERVQQGIRVRPA